MSNPKAQAAKEKGNQAFKAGDYPTAIGHYTSAIFADQSDATFYLNRAAAYLKLGKYEDAERDCTTVLGLSKNNVKALFRRGQARVGLDQLLEAEKDFSEVLRIEPSNTAAQDELKNVTSLIQKEKGKKKKAKSPISPVQSSLAPETTTGKRRRVPIKIIDASAQPVTSAPAPTPSKKADAIREPEPMEVDTEPLASAEAQARPQVLSQPSKSRISSPDTLEAVSSRSLKSPSSSPAFLAPKISTSTPPKPSSSPQAPQPQQPPQSAPGPKPKASPNPSFKDAKEARESTKPSRVGGGIFRKNGESTIFPTRGDAATSASPDATRPADGSDAAMDAIGDGVGGLAVGNNAVDITSTSRFPLDPPSPSATPGKGTQKPPTTLFEFSRLWESLKSPEQRWGLINMIPPAQFPTLCKTSLEPALLVSILEVFVVALQSFSSSASPSAEADQLKLHIKAYLDAFALIPRFSTLLLFLSKKEKEVVKELWALLGIQPPSQGPWTAVVAA